MGTTSWMRPIRRAVAGIDALVGQQEVHGVAVADLTDQLVDCRPGDHAERHLGEAEPDVGSGDTNIAVEHHLQAAGQGRAVNGCNPGLGAVPDDHRRRLGLRGVGLAPGALRHFSEISAGAEDRAVGGEYRHPLAGIGVELGDRRGELRTQLGRQSVATLGTVEGDDRDRPGAIHQHV